jgi:hypothetical protein
MMSSRKAWPGVLSLCLLASAVWAQSSAASGPDAPQEERNSNLSKPVDRPEAISGVWETSDGAEGAVGIHIQLYTSVSGDADPPVWLPQSWQGVNVGIFHRAGAEIQFGEEGYFEPVILEGDHLQLHFASAHADIPSVDLDLLHLSDGCWHGRFHRGDFDSTVSLCRPAPAIGITPDPLAGTWSAESGFSCLHIFQTGASTFTGWTDDLEVPGKIRFCASDSALRNLQQSYGALAKVERTEDGGISVEMHTFAMLCCPHPFTATLSTDGRTLHASYPSAPNQAEQEETWTKAPGETCVDPEAVRKIHPAECPSQCRTQQPGSGR